jgi:hypothetical protein
VSGGVSYAFTYSDTDAATLGVEYFYNATGYPTERAYPYLALRNRLQPFDLGRHYGALYLVVPGPGRWEDTTVTLSTLGNLSDRSFVSRLDVVQRVLGELSVNGFVSGSYGTRGGEFRFALDPFRLPDDPGTPELDPVDFPGVRAPTVQVGLGLRVSI